jgi:ubiquitin carboxyl-terminal hydrolase 31
VVEGSREGSLLETGVEHPLYSESVDQALALCDTDAPPHVKLHLEWDLPTKDK